MLLYVLSRAGDRLIGGAQVKIVRGGGVAPLVDILEHGNDAAKTHAAGALRNLATNKDVQAVLARSGAMQALEVLSKTGPPEARTQVRGLAIAS